MSDKIVLLDGNSLINRAYYGLNNRNPLTAPDGTPTGALYAFINMLAKYLDDIKPRYAVVAFDRREPTFRHKSFSDYKGTRKPMPDDLAVQIPLLKEIIDHLGLSRMELAGYEADDLLGTISVKASEQGLETIIISGDKDSFQLINEKVIVLQPLTRGGKSESQYVDTQAVLAKYKVSPRQLIDVKAIMGDPSDNIPGVKGIGEKGAIDLISRFGSLDNLYDHLDDITSSQAKKLIESREMAVLSRQLSEICLKVPIEQDIEDWLIREKNNSELLRLFHHYGFKSLIEKFSLMKNEVSEETSQNSTDDMIGESSSDSVKYSCLKKINELVDLLSTRFLADKNLKIQAVLTMSLDKTALTVYPAESADQKDKEIGPLLLLLNKQESAAALKQFDQFCQKHSADISLLVHDYKQFLHDSGADPFVYVPHDIMIAGYLLNQIDGKPDFGRMYQQVTGNFWQDKDKPAQLRFDFEASKPSDEDQVKSGDNLIADNQPDDEILMGLIKYGQAVSLIYKQQLRLLAQNQAINDLFLRVEMPLAGILAQMERKGFTVDQKALHRLSFEMGEEADLLQTRIYELSGEAFNLNSPKQLGEVLFNKLGLQTGKKRSGGSFSTDADELERLRGDHPAVDQIIAYRQVSKLKSTFVDGLMKVIDKDDGRVHTTFSQVQTSTGRLSSSEPNLQNIPIRRDAGAKIREVFIASPGKVLLDADYSQIELRLLAHLSQDEAMLAAFINNQDIHLNTACSIFNLPPEMITPDMRGAAKTVNFSIVYGISDFGLARDLGIPVKVAHEYIKGYNEKYPKVKEYLESLVVQAHEQGYVETMFGRRRYINELKSSNRNVRMFGERAAMNAPVQGTAADLIKKAMVTVDRAFRQQRLNAELILQVHDELIVEASEAIADQAAVILQQAMESAASLSVPLIAEVHRGSSWAQCK